MMKPRKFLVNSQRALWNTVTTRYPLGTNIFSRDWDVLIILDSCRFDAMQLVAPEYEFIDTVDSIISVGSMTAEWTSKTFVNEYISAIQETAAVTALAWYYRILEERITQYSSFQEAKRSTGHIGGKEIVKDGYDYLYLGFPKRKNCTTEDLVFVDHAWKLVNDLREERQFMRHMPDVITDRAIDVHRTYNPNRLLVHYAKPHDPFEGDSWGKRPMHEWEQNPWQAAKQGEIDNDSLFDAHLDNLRLALDHIEILLDNIEADKVILSADHGEMLGEFGLYGHPYGIPHPKVKRVPWVQATAKNTGEYDVRYPATSVKKVKTTDATSQLKALGYIE